MKKNEYRINPIFAFLAQIIIFVARKIFRIKGKVSPEVKNVQGP